VLNATAKSGKAIERHPLCAFLQAAQTAEEVESALVSWFNHAYTNNCTVIRDKALHITVCLGVDSFTGSSGWIPRFERHNIVYSNQAGVLIEKQQVTEKNYRLLQECLLMLIVVINYHYL
jgi:hypothetical protein